MSQAHRLRDFLARAFRPRRRGFTPEFIAEVMAEARAKGEAKLARERKRQEVNRD